MSAPCRDCVDGVHFECTRRCKCCGSRMGDRPLRDRRAAVLLLVAAVLTLPPALLLAQVWRTAWLVPIAAAGAADVVLARAAYARLRYRLPAGPDPADGPPLLRTGGEGAATRIPRLPGMPLRGRRRAPAAGSTPFRRWARTFGRM